MRRTDALIAGGGPAGAAAAIALVAGGARPLIIERERGGHDVVCGGFLGWDALHALARLGIDAHALGARSIDRVRLVAHDRIAEAGLPHRAAGLSRRALDAALLTRAEAAGAGVERGVTIREARGRTLRLADGGEIAGESLFLATGKHELRGIARPRDAAGDDPAIGLRTRLEPSPALTRALDGVIELHLFARGYAGLLLQEDGSANLCLSVARSRLCGRKPAALIAALADEAPRFAERVASDAAGPWQAIAAVPYGWRARATDPGMFRLGDQAAVIASLAGDGVAIALASGRSAARYWLRDGARGALAHQRRFAAAARRPLAVAGTLRRAAESEWSPSLVRVLAHLQPVAGLLARLSRIEP